MMQLGLNLGILAPDTLRCPSGKVSVCQGRDAGDMGSVPWREDLRGTHRARLLVHEVIKLPPAKWEGCGKLFRNNGEKQREANEILGTLQVSGDQSIVTLALGSASQPDPECLMVSLGPGWGQALKSWWVGIGISCAIVWPPSLQVTDLTIGTSVVRWFLLLFFNTHFSSDFFFF